jgi:hypothetical protein
MRPRNPLLWLLALIVTVAVYRPAFAYLDPGTGSILLQVLLGGVAGGLVVVKLYWSRRTQGGHHRRRQRPGRRRDPLNMTRCPAAKLPGLT